ncbi:MAG: 4Fe-4S dicluster domain-containing protein [Deltaproteobacteria bacterium]|jgi:Na+-translocating ferredoxin:NAD+ oxidoreductase RnfC subunit|nr:4Fe-4S dicluster domain-containing protein [Deltaproteobacteria bacterium]
MGAIDKNELLAAVARAGVVGAGGAGFPTAVKLAATPEVVIVNGAECEPLLKVDQQLAELRAGELVRALETVVASLGAKSGILAFKEKYKGALAALAQEIKGKPNLSIRTLGNSYPMGDEQVLVYEVLGRVVPEGGLPLACGALVINVESLLNVFDAYHNGAPVTQKYLTVTGSVKNPATFKVPVGIAMAEVVAAAGGATVPDPVIINGGPMMGKLEESLTNPVTKITKGLIVLPRNHPRAEAKRRGLSQMMRIAKTSCCHCAYCTELCPRYLLGHNLHPDTIMRLASYGQTGEGAQRAGQVFLCCECGLCEQACVMGLQPWRLNHELKGRLGPEVARLFKKDPAPKANRFRELRGYPIPKLVQKLGLAQYDSLKAPLKDFPAKPTLLKLALKQHLGAPSQPIVSVGERVQVGQTIAETPQGATGATVHASLPGRVESIDATHITIAAD